VSAPKPLEQVVAELVLKVADLEKVIAGFRAALGGGAIAATADAASDSDLDGQYGNEKIQMTPRDWKGAPRKGWLMARCEPDFLDVYAEAKMHFATKDEAAGETRKAHYGRLSAARARGWAKRLRAGWTPQTSFGEGDAPSANAGNRGSNWGGGGGEWGSQEAPPPAKQGSSVDDSYASRGGDDFSNDDEIPF
jgi:hypothetical protein